ncbi:MAG TPA: right-handed parallel beta-helix repeat-containing protein [Candidatus Hydrogenedentes bacterium]|nr:right-handed parallel beta-helix repeat-containing protein [Candidatus Hydrogenedentota bacterium]
MKKKSVSTSERRSIVPSFHALGIVFLTMLMLSAGAEFFVSPHGAEGNPGTKEQPFLTLEQARDAIRAVKQQGTLPEGGIVVNVLPGLYPARDTFRLTEEDSGTAASPITYRGAGAERPRFTGGVRIHRFALPEDEAVLARLPESARGKVWQADLAEAGVAALIPFERGGFAGGRGFLTHPEMELFVDGAPMTVARWPNDGFVQTGEVPGPLTLVSWDKRPGAEHGRFRFESERLARWAEEPNGWLYGYWFWEWADSYEQIAGIDLEKQEISLAEPWHRYGYRKEQRFHAVNMLCELDAPGEWYLDHERQRAYLYPKTDLNNAVVEISMLAAPLMQIEGASHLRFQGLLWECGAADGAQLRGGEDCRFEGCVIRKMAGNGLEIHGGNGHVVQSCDIHTLGRGGIVLNGGDRKTLIPGGHLVENCHIHNLSRIDRTYTPAVLLGGVGNRIRHNLVHDVSSSAFRVGGNDHLIELNEVHRVVLESDDQGAVDMWGNATFRGIVFRHNYWRHLGNWEATGEAGSKQRAGIRLDDAISGVLIQGNVFQRVCATPTHFGGVQIHGGKDNIVEGNLFVDCGAAVSFSAWSDERWRKFVADALDDPAIDRELYLQRYPKLAQLEENHNAALVRGNAVVRCDTLFLREHDAVESLDNREYPESDAFKTEGTERLNWSAEEAARYGVAHIPFDQIGLYEDAWRKMR